MPFVTISDGRIRSIKMEFNVVENCNYRCQECSHFSPYLAVRRADLDVFRRDIEALANVYRVGRFRFVGGEPLLHRELLEFVRAVRASGITEKIEVVSNGSLVKGVSDDLLREIDIVSVSWYPDPRCDQAAIDAIGDRCRQHDTQLKVKRVDRFRMMQLDRPIDDSKLVQRVFDSCQIAHSWYCQTIYEGYFYLCSRPIFTQDYLGLHGVPSLDFKRTDGIALHEPDLAERLAAYLARDKPLDSCQFCLGTVGKQIPWRQLTTEERRSGAVLDRVAEDSVRYSRLRYLRAWSSFEQATLRAIPSLSLSRGLALAKNALTSE